MEQTNKTTYKTVTVAKQGGHFDDPVAAVNSIKDASKQKPYRILIASGSYHLKRQLVMKKHIDIIGEDQQQTKLIGSISSDNSDRSAALIVGADDASLSKLTLVQNDAQKNACIGIYNNHNNLKLSDISLTIKNSKSIQYGIFNNHSSINLDNVNIYLESTSQDQYGVFNCYSDVSIKKSLLQISDGKEYVYGVYNYASSASLNNCIVNLQQGGCQYGVYNNLANSFATIENSRIFAETASLVTPSKPSHAQTYLRNSTIKGKLIGMPVCELINQIKQVPGEMVPAKLA